MSMACYSKNCVRIKHIPTDYQIIVDCHRHMYKNKDIGVKNIKAKLYADKLGLQRPIIEEDVSETICPICEKGILKQVHEYLHYEYKNGNFYQNQLSNEYEVLSLYLLCVGEDGCGSEQCDGYCLNFNKETLELLYDMERKDK